MAALPTDQIRQFDYPPGVGRTVIDALAAPPASAAAAAVKNDKLTDKGSDGSKHNNDVGTVAVPGSTNTIRPSSTAIATPNPAPAAYAHRDAYKTTNDTASVLGPGAPVGAVAGTLTATTAPLSWTAPAAGGYAPTGYRVEKSVKSGAVWGAWGAGVNPAGTATSAVQTGTTGQDLRFRVFTVSGNKESPASNVVTVKLP